MPAVEGYPNKTEAIRALHAQGMTPFMIAEKIGSTPGSVTERIRQLKKKAAGGTQATPKAPKAAKAKAEKVKPVKEATRDTRGIWTPEKLSKAHRLFGKIMIYVAEALQVPPEELLEYGLKGVMPPMGEKQRVAQLVDRAEIIETHPFPPEHALQLPMPAQAPVIEPSRYDDEAELAALEQEDDDVETAPDAGAGDQLVPPVEVVAVPAEEVAAAPGLLSPPGDRGAGARRAAEETPAAAPEAPITDNVNPFFKIPARRYRLQHWTGQYLLQFNKSGMTLTRNLAHAWVGTAPEMEEAFKVLPELKDLDPQKVLR